MLAELKLPFSALVRDHDPAQTLNLSYELFVLTLINAVQEQQTQIESLSNNVSDQKATLSKYEAFIGKLIESTTNTNDNLVNRETKIKF